LYRIINSHLGEWVKDKERRPLIIRGARQVGKTFAVRKCGEHYFQNIFQNIVEVNFESRPEAKSIFERDLDPKRIILELSLMFGKRITPENTLLFFDEIQEAEGAI